MNRNGMPRLRSILFQSRLFVGVTLGGMVPYWVAMLVFHNESLYYGYIVPRFIWLSDFIELAHMFGPIPFLMAGVFLAIVALFWFNDLKRPKLRE